MFKYYNALQNRNGDALAGYLVRLFGPEGEAIDLFSDENGTPIITESGVANAAKSDELGMVRFYVDSGTYDIRLYDLTDTFVSAEIGVPMIVGINELTLAGDDGATLIGTPTGNVQEGLDDRPTSAVLASSTGGEMVGYDQGTAYASQTVGAALKRFIIITEAPYNADSTGVDDVAPAFAQAITDAAGAPIEIIAKGSAFLFESSVDLGSQNVSIRGDGETEFRGGAGVIMFTGDGADKVKFKDIAFVSTTTSLVSITGAARLLNCNDLRFIRCRFDRVAVNMWSTQAATCERFKLIGCTMEGDYTNTLPNDIVNVFDLRGIEHIIINGGFVTATDYYRLFKFSTAVIAGNAYNPDYSCGEIVINGMEMTTGGDAVQQIIDFSFNTRAIAFTGNKIRTVGTSVPYILHAKSAYDAIKGGSTPDMVNISGNTLICGSGTECAIYMESNWGIPGFDTPTSITIASNEVISEADTAALIAIKGFNRCNITGLTTDQAPTDYGRALAISNCQNVVLGDIAIGWGTIEISGGAATNDGVNYTLSPQSLLIGDVVIEDFRSQGGINIFHCAAMEDLTIHDAQIRNQTDNAIIQGAIHMENDAFTRSNIHDVTANLANTAKNYLSRVAPYSVTQKMERGNSWNEVSLTWDPGSVARGDATSKDNISIPGAEMGDWIQVSSSLSPQGLQVTAYLTSVAVATILATSNLGGPVDLGSSTWRLAYGRG